MPVPSRERVIELLAGLMPDQGYDLEDVTVSKAGSRSVVRVMVDSDTGLDLDDVAELSRRISDRLDATTEFGETPYTLEVTSPGVDRPLTEPRHWRRAQGRRVQITLADEKVVGRVGLLRDEAIDLVVPAKGGPVVREVALGDVVQAVVQVEFSRPNAQEMELAGGLAAGRAAAGEITEGIETDDDIEGGGLDK
ncbi:ribosome maturation factor RimP [Rhodococcus gannanensis]|uniref:Ribosome maturation factor RimP n=1 Tax=Rhodococcus gannanensis TaxID=1960308 RepID=A0ABW4P6Z7_9NOCA